MKNLYIKLMAVMMLCSLGAYSQTGKIASGKMMPASVVKTTPVKGNDLNQKDFDNPIWTDDFSDASNWIIGNDAGNDDDWVIGTDGPSGGFAISTIASTTADNGFALFDSDLLCSGNQNAWIQNANPIPLTGETGVSIRFETYYRKYQGTCYLETSTNGTDWGNTVELFSSLGTNDYSGPNPTVVQMVLPGVAGSSTAYFRFRYEGGCDYAWMIDDVAIASQPEHSISFDEAHYNDWIVALDTINNSPLTYISTEQDLDLLNALEYNRYQEDAVRPLSFTAVASNLGSEELTGVTFTATVTDPDGMEESFSSDGDLTIPANSSDTIVIADQQLAAFDLGGGNPKIGQYMVAYNLTSTEAEPPMMADTAYFMVDEEIMANDNGDRINSIYSTLAENVIWANRMSFEEDQKVNMIQFQVTNLTSTDQTFTTADGQILFLNVGTGSPLGQTGVVEEAFGDEEVSYVTNTDEISTAGDTTIWINMMLPDTLTLSADMVHQAEIHLPASADSIFVGIATGQETYAGMVFDYGPDSGEPRWFTLGGNVPIIRLGYTSPVGVDGPNSLSFKVAQNYPNPTTGHTQIDWELLKPAKDITFRITDNTGKLVYTEDLGDKPAGVQSPIVLNLDLASGVYQYSLQIGNQRLVNKMTIVK